MRTLLPHGSMDYVICNPPYFGRNTGAAALRPKSAPPGRTSAARSRRSRSRRPLSCTPAAKRPLCSVPNGCGCCSRRSAASVSSPSACASSTQNALAVPSAVLVECRKGGSAEGLSVEPPLLVESEEYLKIYGKTGSSD
ncbi:MAG: hypothetical protein ACLR4Z_03950 [Butyricicoccaceae bacterium]